MLSTDKQDHFRDEISNPLDGVEEIMMNNDWIFDRIDQDEMTVDVSGNLGHYKMTFIWQEEYSALQFSCAPDLTISSNKTAQAANVINKINASLWLGHFDIRPHGCENDIAPANIPCFRHTCLFRGMTDSSGIDYMEDVIDIALHECERYYMTFELLSQQTQTTQMEMSLALMDIAGCS